MSDIVKAQAHQSEMAIMFASIVDLAKDPAVDPSKMEAIVNLQLKMLDHQKLEEFNRDKIAALLGMPTITKRGAIKNKNSGVQSRYSKFEDIDHVTRPILARHNMAITFNVDHANNMVTVQPVLSHRNGHVEVGGKMALPIDTSGSKNATQGSGSSASYGKRHQIKAMLNIIEEGEDTDGQVLYIEREGWQEEVISDGQFAAAKGSPAYLEWFQSQTNMKRGYLVDSGEHEKLKDMAKSRTEPRGMGKGGGEGGV